MTELHIGFRMPIVKRLEVASARTPISVEKSDRSSVSLFKGGFAVLLIIQGLLDEQDRDLQIKKSDSPIYLPPLGLGNEPFYVGRDGKKFKKPKTEDSPTENSLRFQLGNYFYSYRRSQNGKNLNNHWLIRRSIRNPQVEANLWVSVIGKNGSSVARKAEYHSYRKRHVASSLGREEATVGAAEMIDKMKQDLASGKLPKRA